MPLGQRQKKFIFRKALRKTKFPLPSQRLRALSFCSHAVRDDLKRDLAVILLLFVSCYDLKQDLPGIMLKIVKARKKVVNLGKL